MTREATNWILEQIDDGILSAEHIVQCCLRYMSEYDVQDMCHSEELGWPGNDNYSGRKEEGGE